MEASPPPPPPGKRPEETKKAVEEPANDQKEWSNPLKMLAAAAAVLKPLEVSGDAAAGADKSVVMEDAAAAARGKGPEAAKSVPSRMVDLAKDVLGFAGPAKRGEKRKADSPAAEEEPVKKQKPDPIHPMIKAEQAAGTGPVIDDTRTFRFAGNAYSRLPNPRFTQRKLKGDYFPNVPPLERFIRESVSSGNKWVFSKQIGEGGYGTAELWYLMDKDDEVLDEIVIKHCSIFYRDYYDWRFWENGWKTADKNGNNFDRNRVLEAAIHDRLTKAGPWYETGISKFITDWLAPDRRSYKLYLEYARLGTLDRIVPMSNSRSREEHNWEVPEPVIWYWLHCMMRAALTMQQSFAETSGDQLPPLATVVNWKPIVHLDIKEGNIILQRLGERGNDIVLNEGLEWPMPLLIDFGLAIELLDPREFNWDNPKDYKCGGTPGYMAPEQLKSCHIDGPNKGKRFEFGSHTNVFAIGLTIYNLVRGDHTSGIHKITEWGRDNIHLRGNDHVLLVPNETNYSDGLFDFLAKCTARNPDDRPKLDQELLDYLRNECQHWFKYELAGEDGKYWGPFSGFADKAAKISKAFKVYVEGWIPSIRSGSQYANNYGEPGYGEEEEDDVVTRELVAEGEEDAEGEPEEDVVMVPGTKPDAGEGEQDAEGEPDDDVEMVPGTKPDVAMGEGA